MDEINIKPENLTKDDLYEITKKWVVHELEIREINLDKAAEISKAVLDTLDKELVETTPFNALMHLSQSFPEIMDITLREREEIEHEKDQQVIDYISYWVKAGDLSKVSYLIPPKVTEKDEQ